ncbi:Ubiquitin-conjugating enzyme E2 D2 [Linnemannia elongata]|nr:Ubiquitin-conjugating enzyme E2 D2 [Linnemannia elongata]
MALHRINKELDDITTHPTLSCTAAPTDDDMFHWRATINGPEGSPYAGGVFSLDIIFQEAYPDIAPKVTFITKIYHPNISRNGIIDLDIFEDKWSPHISMSEILLLICSLLTNPNLDEPLVPEIAHIYMTDRNQYDSNAREWTRNYATVL